MMSKLAGLFRMDINNGCKCFVLNGFFLTFACCNGILRKSLPKPVSNIV